MTTLVSWIQLIIIPGGQVTARGCSTMQPTFNKCETHKYGQFKSDKYCYCKETFCNNSTAVLPNIYSLGEQHQPRLSPSFLGGEKRYYKVELYHTWILSSSGIYHTSQTLKYFFLQLPIAITGKYEAKYSWWFVVELLL